MKRSFFYIAVAAVQSVGSIGGPLLAARLMGPAQLGILAVAMLAVILIRAVASLGLYGPISVSLHEGAEGVAQGRRLLSWSGVLCLPLSLALGVAALFVPADGASYLSAAGAGVAGAVSLGHQALHRSVTNHAAYATAVLGPTAYANLGGLAALAGFGGGARTYVSAMAFVSLLTAAVLHARHLRGAGRPSRAELQEGLRVGLPLVVTASATVALSLGDRPIIQAFLDDAAVGRYHLTYIIAGGGVPLLGALNNAWLPMVLDVPERERMAGLARSITGVVRGTAVLSLGALIVAPPLVLLIGGPEYFAPDTAWLALAVALGVVPFAVYSGMSIGLLSARATRRIAIATVAAAVTNLAANLLLIPTVGLVGGGIATIVSYSCAAAIAWHRLGWRQAIDWATPRLIVTVLALGALGVLASILPVAGSVPTVLRLVLGALIGALGCLLVARSLSRRAEPVPA